MTSPPQQPGQGDPDQEPDESATRADGSTAADQSSAEQSGSTGTSEQPPAEDAGAQDGQATGEGTQSADGSASAEAIGQDDTTAEGAKPKKKKTGLLVGITAAVVVLAGAVVAGFLLLGTASAQTVAEDFAEVRTRDMNTLGQQVKPADYEPLVCGKIADQMRKSYDPAKVKQQVDQLPPQMQDAFKSARMKVSKVTEKGDKATATFEISAKGQKTEKTDFSLTKEEGKWKMCG